LRTTSEAAKLTDNLTSITSKGPFPLATFRGRDSVNLQTLEKLHSALKNRESRAQKREQKMQVETAL
jgi:hypothetical protein